MASEDKATAHVYDHPSTDAAEKANAAATKVWLAGQPKPDKTSK